MECIVSNERLDFRATYAKVIPLEGNQVAISREVATALEVGVGDQMRIFDYQTHMSHISET
jgi:arginine/ornithine N-succinyltransferase beta subunit